MNDNEKLVEQLLVLARKISNGEITARQLQLAIDQKMLIVKDQPMAGQDPAVKQALAIVATSFIEAWVNEAMKIGQQVVWHLGYGVAVGNFGPEFLKDFMVRAENEKK